MTRSKSGADTGNDQVSNATPDKPDSGRPVPAVAPETKDSAPPLSTADLVAKCEPSVAVIAGKNGGGTGFLVRRNILVTNSHVIEGEPIAMLEVRFPSAEKTRRGPYHTRLLYQDRLRDLAFLAVETELPPLEVAGAYKFRKGEDITVIGSPGLARDVVLENAVSRGIVSSMLTVDSMDFLQLDVSINPGNSGGPVFDSRGRVIGVATLKAKRQEGLAFCVPAQDLQAALAKIDSQGNVVTDIRPPIVVGGSAPTLSYGWAPGRSYTYAFEITIGAGSAIIEQEGTSVYRMKLDDKDGVTLKHSGWSVTRRRGKDGRVVGGGLSGPNISHEMDLKVDRKGNFINATGSSPLSMLGDLSMLVIEPFPDAPQASWEDEKTLVLSEVQQVAGQPMQLGRPDLRGYPGGIRARSRINPRFAPPPVQPQVKVNNHQAIEQTKYRLGEVKQDRVPIQKAYSLVTQETVGNDPRFKMIGSGTIQFDVKDGIPTEVNYQLQVVQTVENAVIQTPITVKCRLVTGVEESRAIPPPAGPLTSRNKLDEDGLNKLVANLQATDANRRREACRNLYDAAPIEGRRREVATLLRSGLEAKDDGLRGDLIRTLGIWDDGQSADSLADHLNDPLFQSSAELIEALGRMNPTAKSAEAIARWLPRDAGRASQALRAFGPFAEKPLLDLFPQVEPQIQSEICRILKDVGGVPSLPILEPIARMKDAAELGRVAEEAIGNIRRNNPSNDDWASIELDFKSPDSGRRVQAIERVMRVSPTGDRRAKIARTLEAIAADDSDQRVEETAYRALITWGDDDTKTFLIARLGDPALRSPERVIESLNKREVRTEAAAEAIAKYYKKDRRLTTESLALIGPNAEKVTLSILQKETDWGARNDLCNLLSRIGTEQSLAALATIEKSGENGIVKGSAQNAVKEIRARGQSGNALAAAISDLKSPDHNRCKEAVVRLSKMTPTQERRAEVARKLEALLSDNDFFMKPPLMKALANWGDAGTADALLVYLGPKKDQGGWKEAIEALVKLRPDAKTAEVAVRWLPADANFVVQTLRAMGGHGEKALLNAIGSATTPQDRFAACRALGECGSPGVIPELEKFVGQKGQEQLSRDADDAVKAITARVKS